MAHQLPQLGYSYDALEPHIDARTMEIHHTKHHNAYVTKLNDALKDQPKLADRPVVDLIRKLNDIPEKIRTAVRNHGGGHANHTFFWEIMTPGGRGQPKGKLADAIKVSFGGFENFQKEFANAAATRFGSGWAWLCLNNGKLCVCSTPNQDSPWMEGNTPILGCDVWEHAYYLKYQNRRPDYVTAWWNCLNWDKVTQKFEAAGR